MISNPATESIAAPGPSASSAAGPKSARPFSKPVQRKWIRERTLVKILVEPQGAVVALTTRTYSYLFILSKRFVGVKRIRTADRLVARAEYSTVKVLELIRMTYPDGG